MNKQSRLGVKVGRVAAAALLVALVPASSTAAPVVGTRTRAIAEWLRPTKHPNHFKLTVVDIVELRTPEGVTSTSAYVGRGTCDESGNLQVCGSDSEKIRKATLAYDPELTTATARVVLISGKVLTITWDEVEPIPDGIETTSDQCGDQAGTSVAVAKHATARAKLYGLRLQTKTPEDRATLSRGAAATEC